MGRGVVSNDASYPQEAKGPALLSLMTSIITPMNADANFPLE